MTVVSLECSLFRFRDLYDDDDNSNDDENNEDLGESVLERK